MTPFSARGRFCAAEATNTSDGGRIAICQARRWLPARQWQREVVDASSQQMPSDFLCAALTPGQDL